MDANDYYCTVDTTEPVGMTAERTKKVATKTQADNKATTALAD